MEGTEREPTTSAIIWTFLCQLVSQNKGRYILKNFFHSVLKEIYRNGVLRLNREDTPDTTIRLVLNTETTNLWGGLRSVLESEQDLAVLVVIDGLDEMGSEESAFIKEFITLMEQLQKRVSGAKAFLTSRTQQGIRGFDGSLHIEYDEERKGSIFPSPNPILTRINVVIAECLSNLRFENTRYQKIGEVDPSSLAWLPMETSTV